MTSGGYTDKLMLLCAFTESAIIYLYLFMCLYCYFQYFYKYTTIIDHQQQLIKNNDKSFPVPIFQIFLIKRF